LHLVGPFLLTYDFPNERVNVIRISDPVPGMCVVKVSDDGAVNQTRSLA
jgi:hypothetical protein